MGLAGGVRPILTTVRRAALVLVGLGLAGCGRGVPPPTGGVRGTVTFQGRPLAGGLVVFAPDRDRGTRGKVVTATVADDGSFSADGLAAGWHRVAVADPPGIDWAGHGWPNYPAALRRPDRSGLEREILPGRVTELHFHVEAGD
jgi:hypothetical protein